MPMSPGGVPGPHTGACLQDPGPGGLHGMDLKAGWCQDVREPWGSPSSGQCAWCPWAVLLEDGLPWSVCKDSGLMADIPMCSQLR